MVRLSSSFLALVQLYATEADQSERGYLAPMCIPKAAGERTANSDLSCLHTSFSLSTMSLSSVFSSFFQTVHADAPEEKEAPAQEEAAEEPQAEEEEEEPEDVRHALFLCCRPRVVT